MKATAEDHARNMQRRGEKAARAAHAAIFAEIDNAEHLDDNGKTGCAIYAVSILYASFMRTLAKSGGEGEWKLAYGLFVNNCAPAMMEMAKAVNDN